MKAPATRTGTRDVLLALTLLGWAGCSSLGESTPFDPQELDSTPGWVRVRTTPVTLQREKTDCGAASLAMVFAHWSVGPGPEEVVRNCPMIPEKGIRAGDLRDYARSCGLESYLIHGCWEDLGKEVAQDHPVIVGLVKPDGTGIMTHYEVVVAVHPALKSVVTLDPARGWCRTPKGGFMREWEPAGFLTLVFYRGDQEPPPGP